MRLTHRLDRTLRLILRIRVRLGLGLRAISRVASPDYAVPIRVRVRREGG